MQERSLPGLGLSNLRNVPSVQPSLTGNIVFANEAIVDTVFQLSKVDEKSLMNILAEVSAVKSLKTTRTKANAAFFRDSFGGLHLMCGGGHD